MTDEQKSKVELDARRVAEYLAQDEEEFGHQGVSEGSLTDAVGLSREEAAAAVDYLENREDVVRIPHPSATPPQTILKPGRGWPELRNQVLGGGQ